MSTKFLSPGWRMPRNANQSKQSSYSIDFNGVSQYVDTGDSVLHTSNATAFTLSAWIKPKAGMSLGVIAADAPAASPTNGGFWIGYDNRNTATRPANGISYNIKTSTGYQSGKSNDNAITLNAWNHIVLVLDGQATLYINGVSSTNRLSDNVGDLVTQSHELLIGTEDTLTFEFNGLINEVSIFDYAFSPSQVTTLWGGGTSVSNPMALPSPPIAYYPLGTSAYNGEYLAENNAIGDYVFDFVPSDDVINISNNSAFNLGTSFTISGWFNFDTYKYQGLISFDSSSTRGWFLFQFTNADILLFDGTTSYTLKSSYTTTNQWDNFIVTYDGADLVFYINGVQESTQAVSVNLQTNGNDGQIGNNQFNTGRYFNGSISNVQVFNTALSSTEAETLYNYGSPIRTLANIPQNSNLKAWYKLDASEVYNSSTTEWKVNNALSPWTSSLDFDGSNDYIDCGNSLTNGFSQLTISIWANFASVPTNMVLGLASKDNTNARSFDLRYIQNTGVNFLVSTDGVNSTVTPYYPKASISAGQWIHFVGIYDGSNVLLYVNGAPIGSPAALTGSLQNTTSEFFIGKRGFGTTNTGFDGQLSNVAVFNTGLSQSQVTTLYNNGTPEALISHSPVSWWKLNNTTTGIEDSKGSNDGTNNGATEVYGSVSKLNGESSGMSQANLVQSDLQTVAPYSKYAIKFEAASGNERIQGIGSTLGNGFSELSISAWVKYSSLPGNQYWPIIAKSSGIGTSFALQNMRSGGSSNGGELYFNVQTQNGSFTAFSGFIPSANVWYNVVGTYNGSEVKIYINNSLKGTLPATGIINTNNTQVWIGDSGYGGYSSMFKGIMSNISVWDTGLTSSQVTEIYNEGLPSNLNNHSAYSNLVSWWQLGENSSFDGNNWLFADEKGSNNGESINMTISDLVDSVGTTANGVSSGMSEGNLVGDAPYSTANAISSNMVITSRVTGSGNTP